MKSMFSMHDSSKLPGNLAGCVVRVTSSPEKTVETFLEGYRAWGSGADNRQLVGSYAIGALAQSQIRPVSEAASILIKASSSPGAWIGTSY
jgi:hypothetical protein